VNPKYSSHIQSILAEFYNKQEQKQKTGKKLKLEATTDTKTKLPTKESHLVRVARTEEIRFEAENVTTPPPNPTPQCQFLQQFRHLNANFCNNFATYNAKFCNNFATYNANFCNNFATFQSLQCKMLQNFCQKFCHVQCQISPRTIRDSPKNNTKTVFNKLNPKKTNPKTVFKKKKNYKKKKSPLSGKIWLFFVTLPLHSSLLLCYFLFLVSPHYFLVTSFTSSFLPRFFLSTCVGFSLWWKTNHCCPKESMTIASEINSILVPLLSNRNLTSCSFL